MFKEYLNNFSERSERRRRPVEQSATTSEAISTHPTTCGSLKILERFASNLTLVRPDLILSIQKMIETIAGKNIEDLTSEELETIAQEAGREAIENAKKRGSRITELREGQLVWVYPDGRIEPVNN